MRAATAFSVASSASGNNVSSPIAVSETCKNGVGSASKSRNFNFSFLTPFVSATSPSTAMYAARSE